MADWPSTQKPFHAVAVAPAAEPADDLEAAVAPPDPAAAVVVAALRGRPVVAALRGRPVVARVAQMDPSRIRPRLAAAEPSHPCRPAPAEVEVWVAATSAAVVGRPAAGVWEVRIDRISAAANWVAGLVPILALEIWVAGTWAVRIDPVWEAARSAIVRISAETGPDREAIGPD